MKVLFSSGLFWPYIGGAEILSAQLLPALIERGYEFIVVTSHSNLELPDKAEHNGIKIYRFPFMSALSSGNIIDIVKTRKRLMQLKQDFAPDLIHLYHIGTNSLFELQTRDAYPAPLLVTLHTDIMVKQSNNNDTLQNRVLSAADWVVGCSASTINSASQLNEQINSYSSIIYNGLNHPDILPEELAVNPPQLLCIGRLIPEKGFDLVMKAIATIINRFPDIRIKIAGDGPEKSNLQKQALDLGIGNVVDFAGWIDPVKIPTIINSSTIILMPSRREGLPCAAIQSAFMARPIIASNVGGLPEIVVHQETGLIVEKDNVDELIKAIEYLLKNHGVATMMGQKARLLVQEKFNWAKHVNEYEKIYRKLLNGNE
jgi:glycogen(starch) synthase